MKEIAFQVDIHIPKQEFFCKFFEDKHSFIDVPESNKYSLRTKHIAINYHHFQIFVQRKIIWIFYIDTR